MHGGGLPSVILSCSFASVGFPLEEGMFAMKSENYELNIARVKILREKKL
jgi:hypothetical protein